MCRGCADKGWPKLNRTTIYHDKGGVVRTVITECNEGKHPATSLYAALSMWGEGINRGTGANWESGKCERKEIK